MDRTFRMHSGDVLVGDGDRIAALTDGTAAVGDVQRRWSTVGLYRIRDGRIAACWLLPLDPAIFDDIWSGPDRRSGRSSRGAAVGAGPNPRVLVAGQMRERDHARTLLGNQRGALGDPQVDNAPAQVTLQLAYHQWTATDTSGTTGTRGR